MHSRGRFTARPTVLGRYFLIITKAYGRDAANFVIKANPCCRIPSDSKKSRKLVTGLAYDTAPLSAIAPTLKRSPLGRDTNIIKRIK